MHVFEIEVYFQRGKQFDPQDEFTFQLVNCVNNFLELVCHLVIHSFFHDMLYDNYNYLK